jgi:hypothetical protein
MAGWPILIDDEARTPYDSSPSLAQPARPTENLVVRLSTPLRRLLYLALVILWLLIMALPFVAFTLAARGQILLGDQAEAHTRLFLLNDEDKQGVGLEWVRSAGDESHCWSGRVLYFLWQGEGQNATFCQCLDPQSGAALPTFPTSCPP